MIGADRDVWVRCERFRISIRRFCEAMRDGPDSAEARDAARDLASWFKHDEQFVFGLIRDLRFGLARWCGIAVVGWVLLIATWVGLVIR